MAFVAGNELEHAMLLAASDESARPEFYRLLLEAELLLMGDASVDEGSDRVQGSLSIETVTGPDGNKYHPVFTSENRLREFLAVGVANITGPVPCFAMQGRALFACTRGASFVVNPGSSPTKTLVPPEIDHCLGLQPPQTKPTINIIRPPVHPRKLVQALSVLFTSRTRVKSARLVYAEMPGLKPYPLIAIETEADMRTLSQEIFAAAAAAMPGDRVDVIHVDPIPQNDPLRRHLSTVAPFYVRTIPFSLN